MTVGSLNKIAKHKGFTVTKFAALKNLGKRNSDLEGTPQHEFV